jgi:hypothetical protein
MGKDVDVNLENIKVDINSDSSITSDSNIDANINSQSSINVDTSNMRTELVLPQPFRTVSEFAVTEPIVMRNSSDIGLDIRPLVMDFCFKFEFGKLPAACIRQPYQHHFGITLFGMEILGFNLAGESRIQIDEVQKRPQVAWGGEPTSRGAHGARSEGRSGGSESEGIRIRLG